jgi:hypothetical protein
MLKKVFIFIILGIGAALFAGCGASMTVRDVETSFAEPGQPGSAGVLSGASVSSGGEHYKGVQTLGAPTTKSQQTSENGTYEIR